VFTLSYRYTLPILRRYYLRELWHTQGGYLLSIPLLLAVAGWASLNPDFLWLSGFFAGVALTYIAVLYAGYRQVRRNLVEDLVSVRLTDSGLHFEFAAMVTDLPWSGITSARLTKEGVILTSRATTRPVFLPTHAFSTEASAFLLSRVREAGGRVRDGA
jgi:hypothetical protein